MSSTHIHVIRVPSHDISLLQRHASINAPTVIITGMNVVSFAGVPAGEAVFTGVGTAPEYCSSRMTLLIITKELCSCINLRISRAVNPEDMRKDNICLL